MWRSSMCLAMIKHLVWQLSHIINLRLSLHPLALNQFMWKSCSTLIQSSTIIVQSIYTWFCIWQRLRQNMHQRFIFTKHNISSSLTSYGVFFVRIKEKINTLGPRQDGRHFPDNISLNENVWISIKISSNFVPWGPIHNIPALVQIMAWRQPGDKPLSEPMMVSLLTHICITRPQWVNNSTALYVENAFLQ